MNPARAILDSCDCTLAVVNGLEEHRFHRRGVADLLDLLDHRPEVLAGASVADKIVGKAAAALMIAGHVAEVYARVLTRGAADMLRSAGTPFAFGAMAEHVADRSGTGRCPLDTACAPLTRPAEMVAAIRNKLSELQQI